MGQVLVRALLPFDDVRAGDEAWVEDAPRVRALAGRGFVTVLSTEPDPPHPPPAAEAAEEGEEGTDGPAGPEHP